jgi:hypothetical protein
MPLSSLSDSPTMKMKAAVSLVVIKFLQGITSQKTVYQGLILCPSCVPEKVGVDQK